MKKVLSTALAGVALLAVTACGSSSSSSTPAASSSSSAATTAAATMSTSSASMGAKKVLSTALAGVALLAVTACGSSSSSSTPAASSSSSAATTAATTAAATMSTSSASMGAKNIVDTAVAAGQFKTLVSLVKAAGLAGALSGPGPLTVFAPTDAAFAKVPKATLTELAHNPSKLKSVLLYHVVKGDVTAAQVETLKSAKTLEGGSVAIHVSGGKVYVNNAQVTKADVATSNGVIHVINTVLIPAA